jgi:hypothetical protein
MRALGPGSVSSFLKVSLDVLYAVVWAFVCAVTLAVICALLVSFKPELLTGISVFKKWRVDPAWIGPVYAAALVAADLAGICTLVIVQRLRRIFQTLTAGDPFHPDNVRRLRVIGVTLAVLELGRYAMAGLAAAVLSDRARDGGIDLPDGSVNLVAWFAVLVIFILAEVFREGARLRRDAELTI